MKISYFLQIAKYANRSSLQKIGRTKLKDLDFYIREVKSKYRRLHQFGEVKKRSVSLPERPPGAVTVPVGARALALVTTWVPREQSKSSLADKSA